MDFDRVNYTVEPAAKRDKTNRKFSVGFLPLDTGIELQRSKRNYKVQNGSCEPMPGGKSATELRRPIRKLRPRFSLRILFSRWFFRAISADSLTYDTWFSRSESRFDSTSQFHPPPPLLSDV